MWRSLLPVVVMLLRSTAEEEGNSSSAARHVVSVVVDDETHLLHFRTEDDYQLLAAGFMAQHGIPPSGEGCEVASAYGCAADTVAQEMTVGAARQIASEAAANTRSFELSSSKERLRSLVVEDHVLQHPYALREFGLSLEFLYKGNHPGRRTASFANHAAFRPLRRRVEELVGEPLPYWFAAFQRSFSNDTDNAVHRDSPTYKYSALLYLTPQAPEGLGTSTWRHRDTGLYASPTEDEAKRARVAGRGGGGGDREPWSSGDLVNMMVRDGGAARTEDKWAVVDRIGNRFNRLLIFNSKLNHRSSALGGMGQEPDGARFFLVLFFNTEDKAGQANSVLYCDNDSAEYWDRRDLACAAGGDKHDHQLDISDAPAEL